MSMQDRPANGAAVAVVGSYRLLSSIAQVEEKLGNGGLLTLKHVVICIALGYLGAARWPIS